MHYFVLSIIIDVHLNRLTNQIDKIKEADMGRRAGVSDVESKFRKDFAAGLAEVIGSTRGAQTRAAQLLGVKRQLVSLYLKGDTTPGRDVIHRTRELWGFPSEYGGVPLDATTFPRRLGPRAQPQQLKLFSEDRQLKVVVLRRSVDSVELNVSINFKERA